MKSTVWRRSLEHLFSRKVVGTFRHLLLVLLNTFIVQPTLADGHSCQNLFQVSPVFELAKLHIAISEISDDAQGSILQSRLRADFDQKLQQLLIERPQDGEQITKELRNTLRRLKKEQVQGADETQRIRAVQKNSLRRTRVKLSPLLQTTIDAKSLTEGSGTVFESALDFMDARTIGVLWSRSGRYVAMRPRDPTGWKPPEPIQIFDLVKKQQVPESFTNGSFGSSEGIWTTKVNQDFHVIDLRHGKKLAGFSQGTRLIQDFVTDQYAIGFIGTVAIIKYYSGESLVLGNNFGVCKSCDILAHIEQGRLKLRRLSTGRNLGIDLGITDAKEVAQSAIFREVFRFKQGGKNKFLFLDDLVVRDEPGYNTSMSLCPGTHVMMSRSTDPGLSSATTTLNLNHYDIGAQLSLRGSQIWHIDQKMVYKRSLDEQWVEFDLKTWTAREIPGNFRNIEGHRYLRGVDENDPGHEHFFDLKTGQEFKIPFLKFTTSVPDSDLFLLTSLDGKSSWLSHLDNIEDQAAKLGHAGSPRPLVSPRGDYLISADQAQVVIFAISTTTDP